MILNSQSLVLSNWPRSLEKFKHRSWFESIWVEPGRLISARTVNLTREAISRRGPPQIYRQSNGCFWVCNTSVIQWFLLELGRTEVWLHTCIMQDTEGLSHITCNTVSTQFIYPVELSVSVYTGCIQEQEIFSIGHLYFERAVSPTHTITVVRRRMRLKNTHFTHVIHAA